MKKTLLTLSLIITVLSVFSQTNTNVKYQQAYYKPSSGTYVQGYYKTAPNNTNKDNYSTTGNTNAYTQEKGTKAQDYSIQAQNYGTGQTIYTGSRGGQYYVNNNGTKTYVPKR